MFDELAPFDPALWKELLERQRGYNRLRSMIFENVQWIAFPPDGAIPLELAAERLSNFGGCCD